MSREFDIDTDEAIELGKIKVHQTHIRNLAKPATGIVSISFYFVSTLSVTPLPRIGPASRQ